MSNPQTKIRAPLAKLQRTVSKFYFHLQQRFEGNTVIRDSWAAMGADLQVQAESLKKLPASFWQSLKAQEQEVAEAAARIEPCAGGKQVASLPVCLGQMLDLEEPIILKVYAPLIRSLRLSWTDRAIDFYVMVRAHIARLERLIRLYAGNPALSQRCSVLSSSFEKEVQEPVAEETNVVRAPRKKGAKAIVPKKAASGRSKKSRARTAAPRAGKRIKRTKPLVKKIEIPRRRAHR